MKFAAVQVQTANRKPMPGALQSGEMARNNNLQSPSLVDASIVGFIIPPLCQCCVLELNDECIVLKKGCHKYMLHSQSARRNVPTSVMSL